MAGCQCTQAAGCPTVSGNFTRLGINIDNYDFLIALAGNPNTGKTTLFNALSGLRQHTGNWPGKTVVRSEGAFRHHEYKYKVVDLPGTYSLLSTSEDEEIARDFILFGNPDCVVVVVDATALERNLNLVLQVLEITDRVVVALNLMDEAERKGLYVDARKLSRELGVPVVPMVAREGKGIDQLLQTVEDVVTGRLSTRPRRIDLDPQIEEAVQQLLPHLKNLYPHLSNHRWLAMRLLEGDRSIEDAIRNDALADPETGSTAPADEEIPELEAALEV